MKDEKQQKTPKTPKTLTLKEQLDLLPKRRITKIDTSNQCAFVLFRRLPGEEIPLCATTPFPEILDDVKIDEDYVVATVYTARRSNIINHPSLKTYHIGEMYICRDGKYIPCFTKVCPEDIHSCLERIDGKLWLRLWLRPLICGDRMSAMYGAGNWSIFESVCEDHAIAKLTFLDANGKQVEYTSIIPTHSNDYRDDEAYESVALDRAKADVFTRAGAGVTLSICPQDYERDPDILLKLEKVNVELYSGYKVVDLYHNKDGAKITGFKVCNKKGQIIYDEDFA